MKRLFYSAGIVLTLSFFASCAQHDTTSPDTSGAVPYNQPGVGVDTTATSTVPGAGTPNMHNNGSNNNQQVNTGDSTTNK